MKKIILLFALTTTIQLENIAQQISIKPIITSYPVAKQNIISLPGDPNFKIFLSGSEDPVPVKDFTYYKTKSKNQRTAGFVLLGTGVFLSAVGLLVGSGSDATFGEAETGIIIMGVGAISGIVSIPLMIMATVNNHKAKLLLESKKTGFGIPVHTGFITGITLTIPVKN